MSSDEEGNVARNASGSLAMRSTNSAGVQCAAIQRLRYKRAKRPAGRGARNMPTAQLNVGQVGIGPGEIAVLRTSCMQPASVACEPSLWRRPSLSTGKRISDCQRLISTSRPDFRAALPVNSQAVASICARPAPAARIGNVQRQCSGSVTMQMPGSSSSALTRKPSSRHIESITLFSRRT
jgi:hypothetical protein